MAQECPQCGLVNPTYARRCDCDYGLMARPTPTLSAVTFRALLFSLKGRIPRSTYWLKFCLPYLAVYLLLLICDDAMGTRAADGEIGLLSGIFVILGLYPS